MLKKYYRHKLSNAVGTKNEWSMAGIECVETDRQFERVYRKSKGWTTEDPLYNFRNVTYKSGVIRWYILVDEKWKRCSDDSARLNKLCDCYVKIKYEERC